MLVDQSIVPVDLAHDEYRLAGQIIGEAFIDDPVNSWVFGNKAGITAYFTLIAKKHYLKIGYGHRAGDLGATLWLPSSAHNALSILNSLDIAASISWHCGIRHLLRGMRVDAGMADHHPKDPHHYLYAIGTLPEAQGKGLGGKLMQAGLARVDEAGAAAYLESSKESNISFYRRFGFELMNEIVPTAGCPPLWPMWREAKC